VVTPAATLPLLAKKQGAALVIINREPTFQDAYADVVIHDRIGEILPRIMDTVKQRLK